MRFSAAHARGLVHRDIKPANILMERRGGRVKVTDFGLARFDSDVSLTASGLVAGTPEFMAPEQASDEAVTPQSDLFSLGVVMYAALTGRSPFRGRNALSTLRRICSETPPNLVELNPLVPTWLDGLIQQLISKAPVDRPASAGDVLQTIRRHSAEQSTPTPPQPIASTTAYWPGWSLRRTWLMAGGLAIATIVVGIGRLMSPRRVEKFPPQATTQNETAPNNVGNGFYVGDQPESIKDLGDAITAAVDGDVIRVIGNGPFVAQGFDLGEKSLTIKADPGYSPVFLSQSPEVPSSRSFLRGRKSIHLQGLEIRWQIQPMSGLSLDARAEKCVLFVDGADLVLSNCHVVGGRMTCCAGVSAGSLALEGCRLSTLSAACVRWDPSERAQLLANNSVFRGRIALMCNAASEHPALDSVKVRLTENTFTTDRAIQLLVGQPRLAYRFQADRNIFDVEDLIVMAPRNSMRFMRRQASIAQTHKIIASLLDWKGQQNAYRRQTIFVSRGLLRTDEPAQRDVDSLEEWLSLWNANSTGSFVADFEYDDDDAGAKSTTPRVVGVANLSEEVLSNLGADPRRIKMH